MSKKGNISVNTTDIFPIIKKWLYSEHDIFVRELVSNASDAIAKRKTLARTNNLEMPEPKINVVVDKESKTIVIEDNGIGMSADEIEKYIAQLAFSGAEEFVQKMKDVGDDATKDEIIGKFGLGFYSAFMVADKVEIDSLSYVEGAKAVKWTCSGDTEYDMADSDRTQVGTKITLHINEESKDFLENYKLRATLSQYCDFMPHPIELVDLEANKRIEAENAKAQKEEDKKPIPHDIINQTQPLWKQDPSSVTDEEYKRFFSQMYPMEQAPLFWLHLNVDHPFTLQGILFFPKFNPNKPVAENNIKLYCKQVFVSDNVKNIVPDFLGLLKGAIDSSDIPLNVSRSSLQGDPNIKKISNYIIKKVAESLKKLFKNDRARYEQVWEDIALFVKYGCVSDTKFDELMREYVLFKNSQGKLITLKEFKESVPAELKDKVENKIIYFEKDQADTSLIKQLDEVGIHALSTDQMIDPHFIQHSEMHKVGDDTIAWASVDAEYENLVGSENLDENDTQIKEMFENFIVGEDKEKSNWSIEVKKLKNAISPAYIKIDHSMKRFQQMTKSMGQGDFNIPLKKTLVLNPNNALIKNAFKLWQNEAKKDLAQKICFYVQDLASISSEGLEQEQKEVFVERAQNLLTELSDLAVN